MWWWGRGRRVSRERLVEEALELTFRLVMSGDAALEALKVWGRGVRTHDHAFAELGRRFVRLLSAPVNAGQIQARAVSFKRDF